MTKILHKELDCCIEHEFECPYFDIIDTGDVIVVCDLSNTQYRVKDVLKKVDLYDNSVECMCAKVMFQQCPLPIKEAG